MSVSLRHVLTRKRIEVSAPCRIDSGGTWDIKTMALPLEGIEPVTVNIALDLRTRVTLLPFEDGRVRISSRGFGREEHYDYARLPFHTPYGLFFAAVSYFGFHGLDVLIQAEAPAKSALGGSSTALIALIGALSEAGALLGRKPLTRRAVLHLGYGLEDAVSMGKCGLQDQGAAVYGGVNRWVWQYGNAGSPFKRKSLLARHRQEQLSGRILVAYSGKSHVSSRINRRWLEDFLSGRTRAGWIRANECVAGLSAAIEREDWGEASRQLREEMAIRRDITPDALIPITETLIDQAEAAECAARFAGAGGGGSLWALGEPERIGRLRRIWGDTLAPVRRACVLDCRIDARGVG